MTSMTAEPKRGFHLLEEGLWEETAVLPRLTCVDADESEPLHQATPVMPDEEA